MKAPWQPVVGGAVVALLGAVGLVRGAMPAHSALPVSHAAPSVPAQGGLVVSIGHRTGGER